MRGVLSVRDTDMSCLRGKQRCVKISRFERDLIQESLVPKQNLNYGQADWETIEQNWFERLDWISEGEGLDVWNSEFCGIFTDGLLTGNLFREKE